MTKEENEQKRTEVLSFLNYFGQLIYGTVLHEDSYKPNRITKPIFDLFYSLTEKERLELYRSKELELKKLAEDYQEKYL